MEALRFQVVGEAFKKKPLDVKTPSERPCKYFGKKVFNREKMYKYLRKDVYEKMIDVMDNGARLDRDVADAVAAGMKQWAIEEGVTHYTHWFQPLRSLVVASAPPLRPVATQPGTQRRPSSSSTTRSASLPYLYRIRVRHSTIRLRCCVRCMLSTWLLRMCATTSTRQSRK